MSRYRQSSYQRACIIDTSFSINHLCNDIQEKDLMKAYYFIVTMFYTLNYSSGFIFRRKWQGTNRCSLLNPYNMINLQTIAKHGTEKGVIPLENGRKKVANTVDLICVKFFLGLYMTYHFYCINRFHLEWPLRKGIVMGVSKCKMLHSFSFKVVAVTLNYIGKLFSIL